MKGDLTVNGLHEAFASLIERVNASDLAVRIKACDSLDELRRISISLNDHVPLPSEEIPILRNMIVEQKKRLLPKPSLSQLLFEELRRGDFVSRHGRGRDELSDAIREHFGERPISNVAPEEVGAFVSRWAKETPRRYALFRLAREIKWNLLKGVPRKDARDVFQLRDAIAECLGSITTTEKNALDAFAEAFAGAKLRIENRERALAAQAARVSVYEKAWGDFKQGFERGAFETLAEGAKALERHYRDGPLEEDEIKKRVRRFRDYFARQAKKEGMKFAPGRKPKKQPVKRAA
jgi:hypothetical protein